MPTVNYNYGYLMESRGDGDMLNSWGFNYTGENWPGLGDETPYIFDPNNPLAFDFNDVDGDEELSGNLLEPYGDNAPNKFPDEEDEAYQDPQHIWFNENANFVAPESITTPEVNGSTKWHFVGQYVSPADIWVRVDDGQQDGFAYVYNQNIEDPIPGGKDIRDFNSETGGDSGFTTINGVKTPTGGDGTWYRIMSYGEAWGDSFVAEGDMSDDNFAFNSNSSDDNNDLPSQFLLLSNTDWPAVINARTEGALDINTGNGELELALGYFKQLPPICFLEGTFISTPCGPRAIETLKPSDLVDTPDGPRPVRFVSKSSYSPGSLHSLDSLPVRISMGALGAGLPSRDLYVTGGHAILVEGYLVHTSALINGTTIVRTSLEDWQNGSDITYYNIELAEHSIISAEGLSVESYIDIIPRQTWQNYSEYINLYGTDEPILELDLPRILHTRQLPSGLKQKLASLTDATSAPEPALAAV